MSTYTKKKILIIKNNLYKPTIIVISNNYILLLTIN